MDVFKSTEQNRKEIINYLAGESAGKKTSSTIVVLHQLTASNPYTSRSNPPPFPPRLWPSRRPLWWSQPSSLRRVAASPFFPVAPPTVRFLGGSAVPPRQLTYKCPFLRRCPRADSPNAGGGAVVERTEEARMLEIGWCGATGERTGAVRSVRGRRGRGRCEDGGDVVGQGTRAASRSRRGDGCRGCSHVGFGT